MRKYLPNLNNATKAKLNESTFYQSTNLKRGFTLVEILVVLAIIGALLGIGVGAIKNLSTSKGVSTAVPLAENLFDQARQVAKSTGVPTRVVIYSDPVASTSNQRKRFHRMMGVVTGRDGQGQEALSGQAVTSWEFVSRPISLPSGAFFNDNLSIHSGTGSAIFPGDGSKTCFVYEFNSEGALIEASDDGTGIPIDDGQFILQAGRYSPKAPPSIDEENSAKRDVGGFKVYRNGRIATFKSPNQIIGNDDPQF